MRREKNWVTGTLYVDFPQILNQRTIPLNLESKMHQQYTDNINTNLVGSCLWNLKSRNTLYGSCLQALTPTTLPLKKYPGPHRQNKELRNISWGYFMQEN